MLVRRIGHTAHLLGWLTNDAVMLHRIFIIFTQGRVDLYKDLTINFFLIIVLSKTIQFTQKTFTQQLFSLYDMKYYDHT